MVVDRRDDQNAAQVDDETGIEAADSGTAVPPYPIRVVVTDDLGRSRLTVLFRLLLALPHLVWVSLWGLAALALAFVVWLAVLIEGRAPATLHQFLASYLRYSTHVSAYVFLAANPYPGFTGGAGYPVDVEIDGPARQGRLGAAFRLVLAVPALVLSSALAGGSALGAGTGGASIATGGGVLAAVGLLGWFASLVRGRMPHGLRDLGAYALGYGAQATGYLLLLTDRYPSSDPALVRPPQELPHHPVRIEARDTLRRSRLTVFFRLPLVMPHLIWLTLWGVLALLLALPAWVTALALGRVPRALHRFLAAYVRYAAHVVAFLFIVGGPFPGFVGAAGSYPIDLEIDGPSRQSRLSVVVRIGLAIPGLVLASALGGVIYVVAVLGWWHALVTGRMPAGLRNLGCASIRYNAQVTAYVLLLTGRYPYASPALHDRPREEETALVPAIAGPPALEHGAEAGLG